MNSTPMRAYSIFSQYVTTLDFIKPFPSYRIRLHGDLKIFQDVLNLFRKQQINYFYNQDKKEILVLPYSLPNENENKKLVKICAKIIDKMGYYKKVLDEIKELDGNILETNQNVIELRGYSHWFCLAEFPIKTNTEKIKNILLKLDEIKKDKESIVVEELKTRELLHNYERYEERGIPQEFVPEAQGGYILLPKKLVRLLIGKDRETFIFLHADLENRVLRARFLYGLYAEIRIFFDDKPGSLRDTSHYLANTLQINILKERKRIIRSGDLSQWIVIGDLSKYVEIRNLPKDDKGQVKKRLIEDLKRFERITPENTLRNFGILEGLEVNFLEKSKKR